MGNGDLKDGDIKDAGPQENEVGPQESEKGPQESEKEKKTAKAENVPSPEKIEGSRDVLLSVIVVVVAMLAVVAAIPVIHPDCHYYGFFELVFGVLFGAVGAILGGRVGVTITLPVIGGVGGSGRAVGGIGAAILGWLFAYVSLSGPLAPVCPPLIWTGQITIDQIPMMTQPRTGDESPSYFVTASVDPEGRGAAEWSQHPDVLISPTGDRSILQFRLASTGNKITFRMFSRHFGKDPVSGQPTSTVLYNFLGSCQFDLQPAGSEDPSTVLKNTADKVSFRFREGYLETLKEKSDLAQQGAILNRCVDGIFADSSNKEERTFESTLSFKIEKGKFGFGDEKVTLSFKKPADRPNLSDAAVLKDATVKSAKDVAAVNSSGQTEVVGAPGATPSQAPAPASEPAVPPVPVGSPLDDAAKCMPDGIKKAETLSYLGGSDLDQGRRFDLYQSWNQISCLVLKVLSNEGGKFISQNQGRALRLLASTVLNNSGIANPTYWQPNSSKRDFSQSLPAYVDPKLIVNLTSVDDNYVRAEALRFIKLLPNDQIEAQFKAKLTNINSLKANPRREFLSIAATSLYYNRIVEWLNVPDAQKAAIRNAANEAVEKDFSAGQAWMQDSLFNGRSAKPFLAMLYYGKAIVERELTLPDRGQADFAQMLGALKSTSDPYPSRAQHIGQALVFTAGLTDGTPQQRSALRAVQAATEFDLVRVMDGKAPFSDTSYALSSAPDLQQTPITITPADKARVLLQSSDWYLTSGNGKIGWIKSPQT